MNNTMTKSESSAFLRHYGVKGMRWGKRKARGTGTRRDRGKVLREAGGKAQRQELKKAKSERKSGEGAPSRTQQIKSARGRLRSEERAFQDAVAKYEKAKPGSAAEKKAAQLVRENQDKMFSTLTRANQYTAKETAAIALVGVFAQIPIQRKVRKKVDAEDDS